MASEDSPAGTARRFTDGERERLLREHPMWSLRHDRDAITRYLRFDSFAEAFGFMSAVGDHRRQAGPSSRMVEHLRPGRDLADHP